jgi:precorrin-2/cobalt-factor-2 C20-methyltransferase
MNNNTGTLYGIGVGPGDPELLPLKAVRILGQVDRVFTASSSKNPYSLAVNIAREHIPETTPVEMLPFPMTREMKETNRAWKAHAEKIAEHLEAGRDAAFLTLGDPMTYSTYGYILKNIQAHGPHIRVETIPGITSYQAAAARLNIPLVEGEEILMISSGVTGGDRLRSFAGKAENIVLLKAYRNAEDIAAAIEDAGLLDTSVAISKCGLSDEEIITDIRELRTRAPNYWTLILAKQKHDPAS